MLRIDDSNDPLDVKSEHWPRDKMHVCTCGLDLQKLASAVPCEVNYTEFFGTIYGCDPCCKVFIFDEDGRGDSRLALWFSVEAYEVNKAQLTVDFDIVVTVFI